MIIKNGTIHFDTHETLPSLDTFTVIKKRCSNKYYDTTIGLIVINYYGLWNLIETHNKEKAQLNESSTIAQVLHFRRNKINIELF